MPGQSAAGPMSVLAVILLVLLMLTSGTQGFIPVQTGHSVDTQKVKIADSAMSGFQYAGTILNSTSQYGGSVHVDVILNFTHENSLLQLLDNISNPSSPQYHRYLTASQFDSMFSPSRTLYQSAINYFASMGMYNFTTFQDRDTISMYGTASAVGAAFGTNISAVSTASGLLYGPDSNPRLPQWLASNIYQVVGLSNSATLSLDLRIQGELRQYATSMVQLTGGYYPSPQFYHGAQLLWGSDLQVAYNENHLFGSQYDKGQVVATILWAGNYTDSHGSLIYTAPYNQSDILYYFNNTYPTVLSGGKGGLTEPLPTVIGMPVLGAPSPGPSAGLDSSGAAIENTLDLEMIGSLAPGATIYNVYGPQASVPDLTTAFETALNQIPNLTVISNSWGGQDGVDTIWNQYLQKAQALGVTVLASSGDSGDDPNSPKAVGGPDNVQFPASIGYDSYGVTSVGGIDLQVDNRTLAITSQIAWYENGSGGAVGSTGGISNQYIEPSWQLHSSANLTLKGNGRGVPDIAATANRTLIWYTNSTTGGGDYIVSGTSVAAPVEAGIVATMNAYLNSKGDTPLGFLNPLIYKLGTDQYDPSYPGATTISNTPFFSVTSGHNYRYTVTSGYNLVTGMGSIDAVNFVNDSILKRYNVTFTETNLPTGSNWSVQIVGNTYSSGGSNEVKLTLPNGSYDFWVLNVGNYTSDPPQGYINVSGSSVIFPVIFKWGFAVTIVETGLPQSYPWIFRSDNYTREYSTTQAVLFFPNGSFSYSGTPSDLNYYGSSGSFTVAGSSTQISLTFTHGQFNVTFLETGVPAGVAWSVSAMNSSATVKLSNVTDNITFYLYGGEYTFYIHPTSGYPSYAPNISVEMFDTNGQNWTITVAYGFGYFVTFVESGLASGLTWGISMQGLTNTTTGSSVVFELPNGSYQYTVRGNTSTLVSSSTGTVNVTGQNKTVNIYYKASRSSLDTEVLYLVLLFLAIVLLISGAALLRRRR